MECPGVLGQELALRFQPGMSIPILRGEDESPEGFGAAGVGDVWVGGGGA